MILKPVRLNVGIVMKTVIAGSRTITDYNELLKAIDKISWKITKIVSGGARGVDKLGERYAKENNLPLQIYPPNWNEYGKRAGIIRNLKMIEENEALLAIWNGKSSGTRHTIGFAQNMGLLNYVYNVKDCF